MPHIFFERLEQRRSTQGLSFGTSGFFDYGSSFGGISSPSSSFSSSYTQFDSSSVTLGYMSDGLPRIRIDPGPTCYIMGQPLLELPEPFRILPIQYKGIESPKPRWDIMRDIMAPAWPWSIQTPTWDNLNTWTSPMGQTWQTPSYQTPAWNNLNNWNSPMVQPWQTPFTPSPSKTKPYITGIQMPKSIPYPHDPGPMCYAMGPPGPFGNSPTSFIDKRSKVEKVRKTLIAFFRKKGTLSENHRQRLLSSPFDKA